MLLHFAVVGQSVCVHALWLVQPSVFCGCPKLANMFFYDELQDNWITVGFFVGVGDMKHACCDARQSAWKLPTTGQELMRHSFEHWVCQVAITGDHALYVA